MNYRKLWESTYGPIPKDENSRSYDIHHIDGDKTNSTIENLTAVSIQEHYDIHYAQGDYAACLLISLRLKKSPNEISDLSSKAARKRIADGTHHFLKGGPREDLMGDNNPMRDPETAKKVGDKTCGKTKNWTNKRTQADLNRRGIKLQYTEEGLRRQQENGRKQFTMNNPANIKKICEHCGKTICKANYVRWHGPNCKEKPN